MGGDHGLPVGDHGDPELVDQEDLLRQPLLPHQPGQPLRGPVDLRRGHGPDLRAVTLARLQPPLGVEREPDVRLREQLGVALRLGREVGGAGLQVQHHVDAGLPGLLDPRPQLVDAHLRGVVAVRAGDAVGDRRDDLERRHDGLAHERLEVGGEVLRAGDRAWQVLLAEDPHRRGSRVAVERGHPAAGEDLGATAGQLRHRGRGGGRRRLRGGRRGRRGRGRGRGGGTARDHRAGRQQRQEQHRWTCAPPRATTVRDGQDVRGLTRDGHRSPG